MKKNYLISREWYKRWKKHLKGGNAPEPLTSNLLKSSESLEDSFTFHDSNYIKIPKPELDLLLSKYSDKSSLTLSNMIPDLSEDFSLLETPKVSCSNIKLSSAFRKTSSNDPKPTTVDLANFTLSTTQSLKRSFSTIQNIIFSEDIIPKLALYDKANSTLINSCLWIFFYIDSMSSYFIEKYFMGAFRNCPLSNHFSQLFIAKSNLASGIINTEQVILYLLTNFPVIKQLGLSELFRIIIDQLVSECDTNDFITKELFNGKFIREIGCLVCFKKQAAEEDFNDLVLDVTLSVKRSLEIFNREGRMLSFCDHCGACTNSSQRLTITQSPAYLLLTFKRFVDSPLLRLNSMHCKIQKKLKINDACYKIYNIIVHEGDIATGFYRNYTKKRKQWYLYTGKKCCKVSSDHVLSQTVYSILYRKNISK